MDTLSQELLTELECPVCMEPMLPPITFCEGGHNICSTCKPKLDYCPTCRGDLLEVRNLGMENVCKIILYPCKYQETGCHHKSNLDSLNEHHKTCSYGSYKCPFIVVKNAPCRWKGPPEEINNHLKSAHNKPNEIRNVTGKYITTIENMTFNYFFCQAIFTLGEVFFRYTMTTDDAFYSVFQHVGRKNMNKYKYESTFTTIDNSGKHTACHVTPTYQEDIGEIIRNENCVVLRYNFLKKCIDGNKKLHIAEEISMITNPEDDNSLVIQNCPFVIVKECYWQGPVLDIKTHMKDCHRDKEDTHEIVDKHMYTMRNVRPDRCWRQAIFALNTVFFCYTTTTQSTLYCVIQHVGEENNAKKYKYEVALTTADGVGSSRACFVTPSYLEDMATIIRNETCSEFRYGFVKKCVDGTKSLNIEIGISNA